MMTMALELARSHLAKVFSRVGESIFFFRERIGESYFCTIRLSICLPPCRNHSHLHMFVSSCLAKTIVS